MAFYAHMDLKMQMIAQQRDEVERSRYVSELFTILRCLSFYMKLGVIEEMCTDVMYTAGEGSLLSPINCWLGDST